MTTLANYFLANLLAEEAVEKKQQDDAYRLRYSVYCEERGYEDPQSFPDKLEIDEYDKEAVHAIVRHRESDHPLGVVRLVLPDQVNPERPLPIEHHFGHAFQESTLRDFEFSCHNIAEVSRFAISKQSLQYISQLKSSSSKSFGGIQADTRSAKQLIPHISLGLIAMLFAISQKHGIAYWYAAMEPSLSRLLTRLGIVFTKIGPLMNYHGKRQPMIAKVDDLLENIYHERGDFFELIRTMGGTTSFDAQLPLTRFSEQAKLASAL